MHPFSKYALNIYCVLGTVLSDANRALNRHTKIPGLMEFTF